MNVEKLPAGFSLPPRRDLAEEVHILLPNRRRRLRDILDKLQVEQTLREIYPGVDITYADNPVKGYNIKTSDPPDHNIIGFTILPISLEVFVTLLSGAHRQKEESIEEAVSRRFGVRGSILDPIAKRSLIDLTIGYLDIPEAQVERKYDSNSVIEQRSLIREILTRLHPSMNP